MLSYLARRYPRSGLPHAGLSWLALLLCHPVAASDHWTPDAVFVQGASANDTSALTVGLMWRSRLPERWFAADRWALYWESSLARWRSSIDHNTSVAWVTQFGVTPVLRRHLSDDPRSVPWFVEAGVGVNVITPIYRDNDKRFSTAFNFGTHVGLGVRFGSEARDEFSLRLQHFSNASIKKPNPGEDFVQLRYARWF